MRWAIESLSNLTNHPAVRIACFALLFRIGSAILAFCANVVFPLYQREQFTMFGRTSPFWDPFTRFDSGWYYGIARTGYDTSFAPVTGCWAAWLGPSQARLESPGS